MSERVEHYKEGLAHFGRNEFPEAIECYNRALEEDPDWVDCLHAVAMAQMNSGDGKTAVATGLRIVELDPDDAFAHTSLSIFYMRLSNDAEKAGEEAEAKRLIDLAEKEGAEARMISWKDDLKENPDAPPPAEPGSMNVVE
jgi:tetratricopeptide (TPR) repeat protein